MTKRRPPINFLPNHMHGCCGFLLLLLLLLLNSFPRHVAGQNETTASDGTQQPPDDDMYGRKFNPSMAIIMVVLVSAFFIMGFFSVYIRQCAERRFMAGGAGASLPANPGPQFPFGRRGGGLDKAVIDTFPTFIYSSVKALKIGKGSLECAVCLNEFEDDHLLRLLPKCSHVFHHDCVDIWLYSHNICPVCRANLVPEPGETIEPPIILLEPNPVPNHGEPGRDPVCISIENNSTVSLLTEENNHPPNKSKPPRSRSTGMRFTRLFSRSHSTGHSLVQAGEDQERFTLRLPDDVRNRMIFDARLNRTKSCSTDTFPRARSMRTGYRRSRSGGGRNNFSYERFDKEDRTGPWGFSMTPPFISRTGSVRSPLPRAIIGLDIENGERSTDPLRAHSPL